MLSQGPGASWKLSAWCGHNISIWVAHAALEKARMPTSTCWLPAVSPPVWLVQNTGRHCPRKPGSGVPGSFPLLLDGILNCPPLSCAAAEDEVDASQATVLHLQTAPCALIHDGSILGGDGGKQMKEGEREGAREGERGLITIVPSTWLLVGYNPQILCTWGGIIGASSGNSKAEVSNSFSPGTTSAL